MQMIEIRLSWTQEEVDNRKDIISGVLKRLLTG
jgi:hypothetical protein